MPARFVGAGEEEAVALLAAVADGLAVGDAPVVADGDAPGDAGLPAPGAVFPADRPDLAEWPARCCDALPVGAACAGRWTAHCVNGACGPPVIATTMAHRQTASAPATPRPA